MGPDHTSTYTPNGPVFTPTCQDDLPGYFLTLPACSETGETSGSITNTTDSVKSATSTEIITTTGSSSNILQTPQPSTAVSTVYISVTETSKTSEDSTPSANSLLTTYTSAVQTTGVGFGSSSELGSGSSTSQAVFETRASFEFFYLWILPLVLVYLQM